MSSQVRGVVRRFTNDDPQLTSRLEQLETEPFEEVIHDANRPSKVSAEEWDELIAILPEPPSEVGIDAPHWSPGLVQQLLQRAFNVEYSLRDIRELPHQAGFTWKTAQPEYAAGDELHKKPVKNGLKILTHQSDDVTAVIIGQTRRWPKTELCHG